MNRSLKLSMLIALALGCTQLLAVDLGEIQVKSALGQPLLAEIPVHAATPAELQGLTAQLASADDFARAGISGGRTEIPLQFTVTSTAGGQRVIRITSAAAVRDPYLDLLVEVHAASGRSVREFTILLDPPGMPAVTAPAIAAAGAPARAPVQATAPRAAAPATAQSAGAALERTPPRPEVAATAAGGEYGPVASGQTLSGIARSTTPAGVDQRQMLLALKQANPDAFYRDNINALKAGAVLRVPSATEAQTIALATAIAEVRRQNSDWRAQAALNPVTVADAAAGVSAPTAPTPAAGAAQDRLALLPAKDTAATAGNAGSQADASAAALRQNLLSTQENLASVQQQTADLRTRLKDLTDINDQNARLLSLKDSEIAQLQAKLAAAGNAAPAAPATAVMADAAPITSPAAANSMAPAVATADTEVTPVASATALASATPSAVAAGSVVAPAATGAVAPAKAAPGPAGTAPAADAAPWYMQTWAWAAAAGALVLLMLLALLGRRRRSPASAHGKPSSLADRFGTTPTTDVADADGDDVDQDELLDQLAEHPDDIGLHLELATLYYSRRDVERFEAAAEAMHAHITDPEQDEWQDVLHMGEDLVPAHPLFDHHVQAAASMQDDALADFDIDDYAEDTTVLRASAADASAAPSPPQSPRTGGDYKFDFDLTGHSAPAAPAVADSGDAAGNDAVVDAVVVDDTDALVDADDADDADAHVVTTPVADEPLTAESATEWSIGAAAGAPNAAGADALGEFNDDPIDTKLDLARAYVDMGDAEGARAMLDEVVKEGSQIQQDVARSLLEDLAH